MKWKTHAEMVMELSKPGEHVLTSLSPHTADLWHAVTGVVSEAGELIDAVKKVVIYNKPIDVRNVIEELGDLEYYLEQFRQNVGVSREETLKANMEKLAKRYAGGYSDAAAVARADKHPLAGTGLTADGHGVEGVRERYRGEMGK